MAFSILSLGMFAARAFWIMRRSIGLLSGLGPPAFTAIAMSLPMRVKAFAMRSHRLNIVALRVSKIRPMTEVLAGEGRAGEPTSDQPVSDEHGWARPRHRRPACDPPIQ